MKIRFFLVLLLSILLIACAKIDSEYIIEEDLNFSQEKELIEKNEEDKDNPSKITNLEKNEINIASSLIDYNFSGENIILSPTSLNFALGVLANGAKDNTLIDLEKYLGNYIDDYNNFAKEYMNSLPSYLSIANALWVTNNKTYTLNKEFYNNCENYYNANANNLDFLNPESVSIINKWCSDNTNGNIQKVINSIEPETNFIITNALHFDAKWDDSFNIDKTFKKDFKGINKISTVDMMVGKAEYYLENDKAIGFSKKYKDGRYSFIGILPKNEGNFSLESLNLQSFLDSKKEIETNIQLPKFEFEYENSLRNYLIDNGLESSFYNSNFSNIFENKNTLVVDDVLQKCKITVDEEGTIASAITIVITKNGISIDESKNVYIDRPFAFMIYDNKKDVILFIGKIINL